MKNSDVKNTIFNVMPSSKQQMSKAKKYANMDSNFAFFQIIENKNLRCLCEKFVCENESLWCDIVFGWYHTFAFKRHLFVFQP